VARELCKIVRARLAIYTDAYITAEAAEWMLAINGGEGADDDDDGSPARSRKRARTGDDMEVAMLDAETFWMKTKLWGANAMTSEKAKAVLEGIRMIIGKQSNRATREAMNTSLKIVQDEFARAIRMREAPRDGAYMPLVDRCLVLYGSSRAPAANGDSRARGAALAAGAAKLDTEGESGVSDRHQAALRTMNEAGAHVAAGPAAAFATLLSGLGGGAVRAAFVAGRGGRGGGRHGGRGGRPFRGGGPGFQGKCYKCNEAGHRAAECPKAGGGDDTP
jgi:hypothetical protein